VGCRHAVAFSADLEERRDPIRWREIPADIVRAAIIDLVARLISLGLLAGLGAVALLIAFGGSIPAWVAALVVVAAAAIACISWRRVRTMRNGIATRDETIATLQPAADEVPALEEHIEVLVWANTRRVTYGNHVCGMLALLQSVLSGQTPGVSMPDFITRGVLQPARDMLAESPAEGVRLSVLTPNEGCFGMLFSAGHRLDSHQRYRVPIADSLSRIAFEEGLPQFWDDVMSDDRFKANAMATRPFCSMVSLPIRVGDHVRAVFNTIATNPGAFDPADITYITALGTIIEVAVGVTIKESTATSAGA
jgi:hypothetical protein